MNVGRIKLESGVVRISDPCYNKSIWCTGTIDDIKKGTWECFVEKSDEGSWGVRVASIIVIHDDIDPVRIISGDIKNVRKEKIKNVEGKKQEYIFWELTYIDVGVDSGQAGIFDEAMYPDDPGQYDGESWYSRCCSVTLDKEQCGTINGGFVSSSGYGDGSYRCYIGKENNEVVAIKIAFIGDENE